MWGCVGGALSDENIDDPEAKNISAGVKVSEEECVFVNSETSVLSLG